MKENNINIPIHTSVTMNIHNSDQLEFLKEYNITRFVGSRDMSLDQLVDINNIKISEINFGSSTKELANIDITPVQVPHRDEYSETAGYIIKGKNKKALFIPDIDKWEKWDRDLSQLAQEFDFLDIILK